MNHHVPARPASTSRRRLLGAAAGLSALGLAGCATPSGGPSIGRVVVVGGGFGGSTAARYLKMWGGNVDVTLIERNPNFVSCPISNLVVGGHRQMADITRGYDGLKALGVKLVQGEVKTIDVAGRKVVLADGSQFAWDRLVVSESEIFSPEAGTGSACGEA
jgi:sulfide dehydrogenase [flavocytochrome c] flavoprotein subunit